LAQRVDTAAVFPKARTSDRLASDTVPVVVAIPIKPFDAAKSRLAAVLPDAVRRQVGIELARRTVEAVIRAGTTPLVLAADEEVAAWADGMGAGVLVDPGSELNAAAAGAARTAGRWIICHADLPLLLESDIAAAADHVGRGRTVIAPSSDGGTTLLGGGGNDFSFAYGPASFHRHLRRLEDPIVLTTVGFALDLDGPDDLDAAIRHPRGRWLAELLASGAK